MLGSTVVASLLAVRALAAQTPEQVFQGFVDAMNRHDVDAQYSFYAPDMVYVDEGRRIAPPREEERLDRAFERGSSASWSYEIVGRGPDRLDVILTEDMEFYRALGSGPRSSRREVGFRDDGSCSCPEWRTSTTSTR